jgi:hypothetical protein
MSVYENYLGGGTATVLGVTYNKNPGSSTMSASITFSNTGSVDWTYGVGFSAQDSSGASDPVNHVWNCWTGGIVAAGASGNAGSLDQHTVTKGSSVTHTISGIPIPVGMATGQLKFKAGIWKTNVGPIPTTETALAWWPTDGSWASADSNGNTIFIGTIAASITSLGVA